MVFLCYGDEEVMFVSAWGFCEVVPERVDHQLQAVSNTKLFKDGSKMAADHVLGDMQLLAQVLV